MGRLVVEQLGRLLIGLSRGEYRGDSVTNQNTAIVNTLGAGNTTGERLDSATYQRAVERVNEFARLAYEAHLVNPQPNGKPDMIDDAMREAEHYPESYRKAMLEHVSLGPLLAGIDTVANFLSFMVYALLANAGARQRVEAEVVAAVDP